MSRGSRIMFYPSGDGYVMRWKPSDGRRIVANFVTSDEGEARRQAEALLVEAIELLRREKVDRPAKT